jgi:hypothetical protein
LHEHEGGDGFAREGALFVKYDPIKILVSDLYYTPEVTAAVGALQAADTSLDAISQLAA